LYADVMDDADVNYVKLTWGFDDYPPVNPWWYASDPSPGGHTSDDIIQVQWFGAHDDQNNIAGYSILWSMNSTDLPDETIDTTIPSIISPPLADGTWYLHVRSVDSVGNWNDTSFDMGPFTIEETAATPSGLSGWQFALVVLVIVALVLAGVLVLLRSRMKGMGPGDDSG